MGAVEAHSRTEGRTQVLCTGTRGRCYEVTGPRLHPQEGKTSLHRTSLETRDWPFRKWVKPDHLQGPGLSAIGEAHGGDVVCV